MHGQPLTYMLKSAFRNCRINSRDKDEFGHFNFLLSLTIRCSFACLLVYPMFGTGTTDGVDTSQMEAAHKWIVKEHFSRTDKQTCRFPGADYPAFSTPDKCNGDGGADLAWPNETSHGPRGARSQGTDLRQGFRARAGTSCSGGPKWRKMVQMPTTRCQMELMEL